MVQIKPKGAIGVDSPSPRSFRCGEVSLHTRKESSLSTHAPLMMIVRELSFHTRKESSLAITISTHAHRRYTCKSICLAFFCVCVCVCCVCVYVCVYVCVCIYVCFCVVFTTSDSNFLIPAHSHTYVHTCVYSTNDKSHDTCVYTIDKYASFFHKYIYVYISIYIYSYLCTYI